MQSLAADRSEGPVEGHDAGDVSDQGDDVANNVDLDSADRTAACNLGFEFLLAQLL